MGEVGEHIGVTEVTAQRRGLTNRDETHATTSLISLENKGFAFRYVATARGYAPIFRNTVSRMRQGLSRAVDEEFAYGHGFLFAPLMLGLGSFVWFAVEEPLGPVQTALLMCICGMAALLRRSRPGIFRSLCVMAALFAAGMVLAAVETTRKATIILDTPVTTYLNGVVLSREVTDRGHWRYTVMIEKTAQPTLKRPPDVVTLLSRSRHVPIDIGESIEGRVRLSPPSGPALPGLNDFAFDSYFNGIGAVGYFYGKPAASAALPSVGSLWSGMWAQFWQWIAEIRAEIGMRIRAAIGGDAGAIAAALVTAEERAISRPTIDALREAGLAHVLAISGLNMVLAAGTFLIGARTMLSMIPGLAHRLPIKKVAAAGALIMVCFYILISGGAVSAVRSWIMISIMLIAVFFDRPSISLRNVALSAIVILVVTPSAVTGPGFQMSFAATLALVAGYARWKTQDEASAPTVRRAGHLRPVYAFFSGLLLSSLIGGLSTMIYSAGHFHRLPAYGLVGNLLAMPVISIMVMPFALIAMLVMPLGLERYPLMVMGQGLQWMIDIAQFVSSWGGQIATGRIPDTAFFLIALGGIIACLFRSRLAVSGLAIVLVGVLAIFTTMREQPALVISEDGRLVGLVSEGGIATNTARPPDFIFSQWQRALRLEKSRPPVKRDDLVLADAASAATDVSREAEARGKPPLDQAEARDVLRSALSAGERGRFSCAPRQWCVATAKQGWRVVVAEDVRFVGPACDVADLVITSARLRFIECRSGARFVGGSQLRRTGALQVFEGTGRPGVVSSVPVMRMEATYHGLDRAWQRHRTYDWRTDTYEARP